MTSLATEPDRHTDGPALVLSIVPDLDEDRADTSADTVSAADLPAIAAELLATIERTEKAVADLVALKDTVRAWFVKFTQEAWSTAEVAGLCSTWERYCESVGVPPRPSHAGAVNVRGTVNLPITVASLRQSMVLTEMQAGVMLAALPENQRFIPSQQSWNVAAASAVLDDPHWDPLGPKSKSPCICPTARTEFARRAIENVGRNAVVDMASLVVSCPAVTHTPYEEADHG